MRLGSLFSGYGGLDLAVEEVLGAQAWWHCEWEEAPSKILRHHWPRVPNLRDVTQVDWAMMPPVDVLTGGYPCQPFSAAGRRKGTEDERHLWPYVREAIRHLRPRYAFLENVRGHRSLGFDTVLRDLAEDGLTARWTTVRASDVGAPHHRERLFVLVSADSEGERFPGQQQSSGGEEEGPSVDVCAGVLPGVDWGSYAPVVRRWERVTRPAPAPTQLNSNGNAQLSAAFAEWMMGLPEGWVSGVPGVSRSDQLKALGNGVVPQQAAAALRFLLSDWEVRSG